MRRGILKPKSSFGKFAKTEEHARWAIRKRRILKLKALNKARGEQNMEDDIPSPYCEKCGHCGEIGCCGIKSFLEEHVRGKTDCRYEDEILEEIEVWFEMQKEEK